MKWNDIQLMVHHLQNDLAPWISDPTAKKMSYSTGIHPMFAANLSGNTKLIFRRLGDHLASSLCFALGEIGLDRLKEDYASQERLFMQQLFLAAETNIPTIVLHLVRSDLDAIECLKKTFKQFPNWCPSIVLHDFSPLLKNFSSWLKLHRQFNCLISTSFGKKLLYKSYSQNEDKKHTRPDFFNPLIESNDLPTEIERENLIKTSLDFSFNFQTLFNPELCSIKFLEQLNSQTMLAFPRLAANLTL